MKNDSQIIWEMYNDGQDGKDKYINAISTLYNHFARHGGRGDDLRGDLRGDGAPPPRLPLLLLLLLPPL